MTVVDCVACGGRSNYSLLTRSDHMVSYATSVEPAKCYAAFVCDNTECHVVVGGVTYALKRDGDPVLEHWPMMPVGKSYPDVPDDIASAADEAHRCASISAGRGAIGLARSVIEAVAKKNGITSGSVENKIDQLADAKLIGEDTREAAHAIRQWGNDAMHGDLALEGFDDQDAEDILSLMDDVIARVYQVRARTSSIVDRRQQRRAGNTTTP